MVTQRTTSGKPSNADKVIEDFYKLSIADQRRVRKQLKPTYYLIGRRKDGYVVMAIKQNTPLPVTTTGNDLAVPDKRRIVIEQWPFPKDEVWQLKVLVGETLVDEAVQGNNGSLTGGLIIDLIGQLSIPYYISEDRQCLVVGNNELAEHDFGPLQPIAPVEALQSFGLAGLEAAVERGSICK